ncbi:MAG TPA: aldehyde dehydrogenase family protein [Acidimicrobiia bacterium]|nr:aldehyde dehydrogenase family protein [Acidimicrobiia bacterium]
MTVAPTPERTLEADLSELRSRKDEWASVTLAERIRLLDGVVRRTDFAAARWVEASSAAKGFGAGSDLAGEEWLSGPYGVLVGAGALRKSLERLNRGLTTYKRSWVSAGPDGRTVVRVLPVEWWEPLLLSGYRLDMSMQPGVTPANLSDHTAELYRNSPQDGRVCGVLGAGNIASIPPLDVIYKLYAEGQVVALKLSPVNDYLGPIYSEIFADFIDRGFLRIFYGGHEAGAVMVNSPYVDTVHITGSATSHDQIVYGNRPEAAERRRLGQPILGKPITSELGGVSPFIVVPGPWSEADLRYQAEHFVTQKILNGGFNCVAAQVLVLAEGWGAADRFVRHVHEVIEELPARVSYYPGSDARRLAVADHPSAVSMGRSRVSHLRDLDPDESHPAFEEEFFAAAFASTRLAHADPGGFLDAAIEFANERLDGTLSAVVIAHPRTIVDLGPRFEQSIARLRYGSVGVNVWTAFNFLQPRSSWGAYPGHTIEDVGSGIGNVHNALLFDSPEKTVARGPFRPLGRSVLAGEFHLSPKPPWFVTSRTGRRTAELFTRFLTDHSVRRLPGIFASALRS